MVLELTNNLESYKQACEYLRDDIDLAIRDFRFRKQNGKLVYAVDFSEIYSYVLPSESYRDFIIFPDAFDDKNEIGDAIALQQLVLTSIFFELPEKQRPILLSPYVLEYRTFVESLRNRFFIDQVERVIRVFSDFERIIDKKLDVKIGKICQKIDDGIAISKDEEKKLAEFVEHYGHIQSVLEIGDNHPFQRIKRLRPDIAFAQLNDLVTLPAQIETQVYDRWVVDLNKVRKHDRLASTELDAAAINLIYEVNKTLDQNTRLVLITRSGTMHKLYQEEIKQGLWSDLGEYPLLRHPRVFAVALAVVQRSNPDDLQDLEDLRASIDVFLKHYETWELAKSSGDTQLYEQISKIKEDWKKIQKVALPLSLSTGSSNLSTITESSRIAKSILHYVRNNNELRARVVSNLDELFYGMDVAHDILGLELQLPGRLRLMEYRDHLTLPHISFLSSPYKIELNTEAGKAILNQLSEKSDGRAQDLIDAFKKAFMQDEAAENRDEEEYERYLVMAYLLALLDKWEIAENYCIRAIRVGERGAISTHEAKYLHAICRREIKISDFQDTFAEIWLIEVLRLLNLASAELKKHKDSDSIQARYEVEEGISILLFHLTFQVKSSSIPSADEGLRLIEEWERKLDNNLPLRLVALRTELDYLVAAGRPMHLKQLQDKYVYLQNRVNDLENDFSQLPAYIMDILVWGKWVLFPHEFMDIDQREILIEQLRTARRQQVTKRDRDEIDWHIASIEAGSTDEATE